MEEQNFINCINIELKKPKSMNKDKNLKKNKNATYQVKESPIMKKLLNKILGPIRFF